MVSVFPLYLCQIVCCFSLAQHCSLALSPFPDPASLFGSVCWSPSCLFSGLLFVCYLIFSFFNFLFYFCVHYLATFCFPSKSFVLKAASSVERALAPRCPSEPAATRPRHTQPLSPSPQCDPSAVCAFFLSCRQTST